jgi:hypothetical protein
MKRLYNLFIIFSLIFFFVTSATSAELPTAKPEEVGLSSDRLNRLGATLEANIAKGVMPGSVVLVVPYLIGTNELMGIWARTILPLRSNFTGELRR